jgi:hypothetical protein
MCLPDYPLTPARLVVRISLGRSLMSPKDYRAPQFRQSWNTLDYWAEYRWLAELCHPAKSPPERQVANSPRAAMMEPSLPETKGGRA